MAIETELKLRISPDQLPRLKRHPLLRSLSAARARTVHLYSVYYDTPDLSLRQHAMALRLRRSGKQWIQTLKGGGQSSAGLHQRNEWETPVHNEQLDLEALGQAGGKLPHGVRKHLRPVFVTDFTRTVCLLEFEGAQIELCMDSGEVRSGQGMSPISELELELKSGTPQQLFQLALELLQVVPLEVEHTSKAEYGYHLFRPVAPEVTKADFPALSSAQAVSSFLRTLIGSCLSHIQSNLTGTLLDMDDEYLHQVRVGLRRLRVVLSVTRRIHPSDELENLYQQVSALCNVLGQTRDWDVFLSQTMIPIREQLPENEGLRDLLHACEHIRRLQHKESTSYLASQDFQKLLLRFGAWMHEEWTNPSLPPIGKFARKIIEKRNSQVLAAGNIETIEDSVQLHRLRIACKKLRYTLEMFSDLLPRHGRKAYLKQLSVLQDILGTLHNNAVVPRLLKTSGSVVHPDTSTLILGWIAHDNARLIELFRTSWTAFVAHEHHW